MRSEDHPETPCAVPSVQRRDDAPSSSRRNRNGRRRFGRRARVVTLAIGLGVVAVPGWSLGRALAANTPDPLNVRVVEWARDHQLGRLVGAIEQRWYAHHQPPVGGTPKGGIPHAPVAVAHVHAPVAHAVRPLFRPPNIEPLAPDPLPNEGVWQPSERLVHGGPALWVTYLRPDAVHTSLLAGVAYFDMRRVAATLHAGTEVPGGGPWIHGAQVASTDYPFVIAAFNSAFRLDNSGGGYYAESRAVRPLAAGRASLVIYATGRVDVGLWGRDDVLMPDVTSVRQNLGLIVDHGTLVPGLADANSSQWGGTVGNRVYVWRSGVGVDTRGNLVYAAGPGLNVETLAEILQRAGCVRAMELDINTWWVSFSEFTADGHGALKAMNLLPSMVRSSSRYLADSTRDFIEMDARH